MHFLIVRDDSIPDAFYAAAADGIELCRELKISEFLLSHGCHYDNDSGCFQVDGPVAKDIEILKIGLLINRVVEVSKESCLNLANRGIAPSRGQVNHAYSILLKMYSQAPAQLQQYSTVGTLVPLFTQWRMIQNHISGISTPDYRYGYGPEIIDAEGFLRPIYTTPFHLYDWRPNSPMIDPPNDTFIIERPLGDPLLAFFCGDHVSMRWIAEGSPADKALPDGFGDIVLSVKDIFGAWAGESLWFVDSDRITFASFSHRLSAAQQYGPELSELVCLGLSDLWKVSVE